MAEGKVVAGAGSAVKVKGPGLAAVLEAAMVDATVKCAEDGISDPEKIRAAKLKAYATAKAAYASEQ